MALVVTAAPVASVEDLHSALDGHLAPLRTTARVATASSNLTAEALGRSSYDTIVSVSNSPGHHTVQLLGVLAAALKPGGRLVVQEAGDSEQIRKSMLLSGLVSSSSSVSGSGAIEASKPSWETGTKAAISLRARPAADASARPAALSANQAWKLDGGEDDDLVDDEALLTEEDKARPAAPPPKDDCEVGASGRKACKNCTCGRADGDVPQVKLTSDMLDNPQPSGGCGSCALGDAFRCGGCPYKGLPAFEYGKPIKVAADFLAADI